MHNNAVLTLVHAFVCSRIDYCNVIYDGLPLGCFAQLKHMLHTAATPAGGF